MEHEVFLPADSVEQARSSEKELGEKLLELYSAKDGSDDNMENDPESIHERQKTAEHILSWARAQIADNNERRFTDSELSLIFSEADSIYDYAEYPDVKETLTRTLVRKVDEAADVDLFGEDEKRDELYEITNIFADNQVAADLLEEAIDGGTKINIVGVQRVGDMIANYYAGSNSAVAAGLVRVEKIGYSLFGWNGANAILWRGPKFQETLELERGISPEETDILYDRLRYSLENTDDYDNISDLLTPSKDNNFAKIWREDGEVIRNIFHRTPLRDRCDLIDDDGNLTDEASQNLIDNFSVDNDSENGFISRHLELFSEKELKSNLFDKVFNPSKKYNPDDINEIQDQALKDYFKLAGSESYEDGIAAKWFASFISDHTAVDEYHNLFFSIGGVEDISAIAEIAPAISGCFDGMSGYRSTYEKDKPWVRADLGLVENSMVLWQLDHPEDRKLLSSFLDAGDSEGIDYAKKFPNFAKTMRIFVCNKDNSAENTPTEDEVINLLTNAIRNRDPYADEYYYFLKPSEDGDHQYWRNVTDDNYSYYKHFTPEAIKQIPAVLTTLFTTGVEELSRNYDAIADRILTYSPENAGEIIKKVEGIYLRKDIPKFAKLYYSADMLYRDSLKNEEDGIPPFLRWAKSEESGGDHSAREVLMTDLLKNSLRSNNSSLRAYLRSCIASKNNDASSDVNQSEPFDADEGDYIEEFTDNRKFRRRFFGYAKRLGYDNPEQMLKAMDEYRDERNRLHKDSVTYDGNYVARYTRELRAGDLIKGINSNYLHLAMQDGFNCPEMAGIGINEDYTHWDTDFGSVRFEDKDLTINAKISGSMANYYGDGLYAIVHNDTLDAYHVKDDSWGFHAFDFSQYEVYGRNHDKNFRGIRTGIGSEDIDAYVAESDNNGRRKALRLSYEMAKNGIYAPIIDRSTEEVIFTPMDYEELRRRMGGMNSRYETLPGEYRAAADLSLPDNLANNSGLKYSDLVSSYLDRSTKGAIYDGSIRGSICSRLRVDKTLPKEVRDAFTGVILSGIHHDHSKDAVEIITTGSSARGTGIPDSIDVDVVMRLDRSFFDNYKDKILEALTTRHKWYYGGEKPVIDGGVLTSRGIRKGLAEVLSRGNEPSTQIEVDISPVATTNQRTFFSEEAASERLRSANSISKTARIAANIIMAKVLLRDAHAYKTSRSPEGDGGLGGLGVENWILQSGGSLRQACIDFLQAADNGRGGFIPFDDFSSRYAVFDMGENHFASNYVSPYDNFVERNMNESGYLRMCNVCRDILQQINDALA